MKYKTKKALKSINYVIGYIYSSDIAKVVFSEDYKALKRVKKTIERYFENESNNKQQDK